MLLTVVYFPSNWELVWYNITFVLSILIFQKMHNRIYSRDSETFTGQVPQLPDQKPVQVVHLQPSNYKGQVWYAILGFTCSCLFPVACAIAHLTCVLNSKYHSNSPEIKLECYNKIQWHQSIVFPVCVYDLAKKALHWEVDYSPFAKGAQRSCLV